MRTGHLIPALIVLFVSGQPADAERLMKFSEVVECVRLDHEIVTSDGKLSALKSALDGKHEELTSIKAVIDNLRTRAEKEKAAGNAEAYNSIVDEYNRLQADYDIKLGIYDKLASEYKAMDEGLAIKKADFISGCDSRRIFRPDLKKACSESPDSDTPFCTRNLKK